MKSLVTVQYLLIYFHRSGELIIAAADGCIKDLSKLLNNGVDVDGFILIAKFIATVSLVLCFGTLLLRN